MLSPLYGQLSPLRIPTSRPLDSDALAYIAAVESADGQALEESVKVAIFNFIAGCKSDGIWNAFKSSCILSGARTLSGALVPLVGAAPTNFNFVSADYNRETGLKGNGSTKYLNSNRNDNADPQNSKHASVFVQTGDVGAYLGAITTDGTVDGTQAYNDATTGFFRCNSDSSYSLSKYTGATGLVATSRNNSTQISYRLSGTTSTVSSTSAASQAIPIHIFQRNWTTTSPTTARLSFYSIGESIDLALLDSRVSNLMTALAAAIP